MARTPRPSTFSIVAVDSSRKEWGVAVQSRFIGAGAVVPWAEANAGAVAHDWIVIEPGRQWNPGQSPAVSAVACERPQVAKAQTLHNPRLVETLGHERPEPTATFALKLIRRTKRGWTRGAQLDRGAAT